LTSWGAEGKFRPRLCMETKQTKGPRGIASNAPGIPDHGTTVHSRRRRNLEAALQCVYGDGPTSRADIARATGLTRATVSELVAHLVNAGLVKEVGPGTSSGGKPPTLIRLNVRGRDLVALDLSRRPFRGALVDLGGSIHHREAASTGEVRGAGGVRAVYDLVASILEKGSAPILGIGVGTPGIVDHQGAVVEAANLQWHGVPLQQELAARFDTSVRVANDAHVAALAEFGAHPGPNLVVVKIGVGIGAGIIVDGRLYRGDRPAAGEIGHIRVREDGLPCTCGNSGCLETIASVPSILLHAARIAGVALAPGDPVARAPGELADSLGEGPLRKAVEEAGRSLGSVLAHLVAILDIHRIVIALELPGWEDELLTALSAEVRERVLPDLASVVEISSAGRGADLVIAGAAALVLRDQLGVVWR
jgi:predicted NBD/HSP70 family sugar kinase